MNNSKKWDFLWWGAIVALVVVLHLALVQYYTPFDTFSEGYAPQTDEASYYLQIDGELVYTNPQNSFWFYNTFPEGDYQAEITYSVTDADFAGEVVLSIINASEYDAVDAQYKTLVSVVLSADQTATSFAFSLGEYSHDIKMFISGNDDDVVLIESVQITSDTPLYQDRYIKAIFFDCLALAFAFGLYYIFKKNRGNTAQMRTKLLVFLALCAVVLLSSYPLMFADSIFVDGHDYKFHYVRVQGIAQAFAEGQFPARLNMAANRGYGAVTNLFYPALFLYLPALLVCFGASVHAALVLFIIALNAVAAWLTYWSFYKISKHRLIAVTTTALYLLSSYRLCNWYTRTALGEYLFLCFVPFMLYAIYHIFYEGGKRWWLLVIAASCVLQSHIIGTVLVALMFGGMIVALLGQRLRKKQSVLTPLWQLCAAGGWTVGLNLWFLYPFVSGYFSGQYTFFDASYEFSTKYVVEQVSIANVVSLLPVYVLNGINYSLGAPLLLALVASLVILAYLLPRKKVAHGAILSVCLLLCVVSLILMCAGDVAIWLAERSGLLLSFFGMLQYPFRWFGVLIPVCCFVFLFAAMQLRQQRVQCLLCGVLLVLSAGNACLYLQSDLIPYCEDDTYYLIQSVYPEEYSNQETVYWTQWVTYNTDPVFSADEVVLSSYTQSGSNVSFTYENTMDAERYIEPALFFAYGYQAVGANGEAYNIVIGDNGRLRVILPANSSGEVTISFYTRKVYQLCDWLTLAFAVAFCLLVLPTRYQITPVRFAGWYARLRAGKTHGSACAQ